MTVNELNVSVGSLGANFTYSTERPSTTSRSTTHSSSRPHGLRLDGSVDTAVNSLVANWGTGIDLWNATATTITGYTLENMPFGARFPVGRILRHDRDRPFRRRRGGGRVQVELTDTTITDLTATSPIALAGVILTAGVGATVTGVTATGNSAGFAVDDYVGTNVSAVSASGESVGVAVVNSSWTNVLNATVTNNSVAVFSSGSEWTSITGVTASNATLSSPWSAPLFHLPGVAAVVTEDDQYDSISNVSALVYPAAYYDVGSDRAPGQRRQRHLHPVRPVPR